MTNIAVTTRKGGDGKTTICFHVATGLATLGYRVAVVDTDSQGHISVSLGLEQADALYDVMVDDTPLSEALFLIDPATYSTADLPAKGALYVLPGFNKTARIATELDRADVLKLLHVVDEMKAEYDLDFVFFDTSPTVKEFDGYIYLATDAFLYVTQALKLSMDGLDNALKQLRNAMDRRQKYLDRESVVLGIVPNMVRAHTDAHRHILEQLENRYGSFVWDPVPLRTVWAEASIFQESLYTYAPSHDATADAWQITKRTLEALQKWQSKIKS